MLHDRFTVRQDTVGQQKIQLKRLLALQQGLWLKTGSKSAKSEHIANKNLEAL